MKYPDFFTRSARSLELNPTQPLTPLDFKFDAINTANFLQVYRELVDSGKLFVYEDFEFDFNGQVFSNLETQVYMYSKGAAGFYFRRYDSLVKPHYPLTMRIYNPSAGWFPEIRAAYPEMVSTFERFIAEMGIKEVFAVSVLYTNDVVPWHIDSDGYYGFRLNLSDCKFKFDLRQLKAHKSAEARDAMLNGRDKDVRQNLDEYCEKKLFTYSEKDLGQAFMINSVDYLHRHYPQGPCLIGLVYGTA